jgi:hypothetical protein
MVVISTVKIEAECSFVRRSTPREISVIYETQEFITQGGLDGQGM